MSRTATIPYTLPRGGLKPDHCGIQPQSRPHLPEGVRSQTIAVFSHNPVHTSPKESEARPLRCSGRISFLISSTFQMARKNRRSKTNTATGAACFLLTVSKSPDTHRSTWLRGLPTLNELKYWPFIGKIGFQEMLCRVMTDWVQFHFVLSFTIEQNC